MLRYILGFLLSLGLVINLTVQAAILNIHSMQQAIEAYEKGDAKAAMDYFMIQANKGNAEAMDWVAAGYLQGKGVKKDVNECRSWLLKAGENGHIGSYTLLGYMYAIGEFGEEDDVNAVKYYKLAAEAGEPEAMTDYGLYLIGGHGNVKKDVQQGLQWVQKACDLKFSEACDRLRGYENLTPSP